MYKYYCIRNRDFSHLQTSFKDQQNFALGIKLQVKVPINSNGDSNTSRATPCLMRCNSNLIYQYVTSFMYPGASLPRSCSNKSQKWYVLGIINTYVPSAILSYGLYYLVLNRLHQIYCMNYHSKIQQQMSPQDRNNF